MKSLFIIFLFFLSSIQCIAQERKIYLNFFTGIASYQTHITQIKGNAFKSVKLNNIAPTGISLSTEFIKNTFIDINFGVHSLYNDYLNVSGGNFGLRLNNQPVLARNFSAKLKYEINLTNFFKFIPFAGYSVSFMNQPANSFTPFRIRAKSQSTTSNGIVTETIRDSIYSSTEFITNTYQGILIGGELMFDFKNNLGVYLSYTFFYSSKYYAIQYGEYRRTSHPIQKANTYFGKNGNLYQIGLRYNIFNY